MFPHFGSWFSSYNLYDSATKGKNYKGFLASLLTYKIKSNWYKDNVFDLELEDTDTSAVHSRTISNIENLAYRQTNTIENDIIWTNTKFNRQTTRWQIRLEKIDSGSTSSEKYKCSSYGYETEFLVQRDKIRVCWISIDFDANAPETSLYKAAKIANLTNQFKHNFAGKWNDETPFSVDRHLWSNAIMFANKSRWIVSDIVRTEALSDDASEEILWDKNNRKLFVDYLNQLRDSDGDLVFAGGYTTPL